MNNQAYYSTGVLTTALRWVTGWTYFSAFWRRLILENKLNADEAGYIGEKFNHFLPNALVIKPVIEYLVAQPDSLWWAMIIFTIVEGIVGFLFMAGLFTRLMSIGVFSLAVGILLGAGWLGTTCLDEWQIGVLGVAAGFTIYFSGGGTYSLDAYFARKGQSFTLKKWFGFLGSGMLNIKQNLLRKIVLFGSICIIGLTLFTNQHFHGGVWGTLHNKSVKPKIEISNAALQKSALTFEVYRTEGADVYGSFLIGIQILNSKGEIVQEWNGAALSRFRDEHIKNRYVAKVKPGKHSLLIPLGARASLTIPVDAVFEPEDTYTLKLIDISGIEWTADMACLHELKTHIT
ncbi:TQO small subunit DoxD [Niabella aquatica]